jgi:hypothetical protein
MIDALAAFPARLREELLRALPLPLPDAVPR